MTSDRPKLMTLSQTWLVALLASTLDQLSKWAVLTLVDLPSIGSLVVVPGLLNFVMAWNKGVNFGLFASDAAFGQVVLVTIAAAICVALSWWIRNGAAPGLGLGVGLIIGGAIANSLDRMVHGAVVDFINVSAFGIRNPFSFNIADAWIFLGVVLIMLGLRQAPAQEDHEDGQA